ncbi:hypothetical protein [Sulfitobacter sp. CW3]|uniref:hypothetical protein n=1 Tax=Sulfitobacter sp. CW3 TaxID=2861965 RepID=UPI002150ABCF|nr:hypothetical protein [Sulfitobacter sp. CW3]
MYIRTGAIVAATLVLGACSTPFNNPAETSQTRQIPEVVAAMAARDQDLQSARLVPEDSCYWYLHAGPVETTLVPLRSSRGNPICAAPAV